MTRLKRATIVLPLVVILLGIVVPILINRDDEVRASDAEIAADRVAGRTAEEWAERAAGELERGRYRRAMSYIKTAESVSSGTQYAAELSNIRRAIRRASEVRELEDRFIRRGVDHMDLGTDGSVASAHRLVTVLPGESLWTLAGDLAAAFDRVLAAEVADNERYAVWDRLTELNGVRELEVGERVRVPVPDEELVAMGSANRGDLELVAASSAALAGGDLDEACRLRAELTTAFAETTVSCRSLDGALSAAVEERDAALALERERELMDEVREALAVVPGIPRATRHSERMSALAAARDALLEAEALREGAHYGDTSELLERLLAEEERFVVRGDGSLVARKAAGVRYTEAARQAVEWMLERELAWSGSVYPKSSGKTSDERAWARYLIAAAAAASDADFAVLLDAVGEERELTLPAPVSYFAD